MRGRVKDSRRERRGPERRECVWRISKSKEGKMCRQPRNDHGHVPGSTFSTTTSPWLDRFSSSLSFKAFDWQMSCSYIIHASFVCKWERHEDDKKSEGVREGSTEQTTKGRSTNEPAFHARGSVRKILMLNTAHRGNHIRSARTENERAYRM